MLYIKLGWSISTTLAGHNRELQQNQKRNYRTGIQSFIVDLARHAIRWLDGLCHDDQFCTQTVLIHGNL